MQFYILFDGKSMNNDNNCLISFKVPDVLFTTIDLPPEAAVTGKGCLIQAREKKKKKIKVKWHQTVRH